MSRGKYIMHRSTRKRLLRLCFLQSYICHYCKKFMLIDKTVPQTHPRRATLDHMIPLSRGGANKLSNIVACCRFCNHTKGSMTIQEYLDNLPNICYNSAIKE